MTKKEITNQIIVTVAEIRAVEKQYVDFTKDLRIESARLVPLKCDALRSSKWTMFNHYFEASDIIDENKLSKFERMKKDDLEIMLFFIKLMKDEIKEIFEARQWELATHQERTNQIKISQAESELNKIEKEVDADLQFIAEEIKMNEELYNSAKNKTKRNKAIANLNELKDKAICMAKDTADKLYKYIQIDEKLQDKLNKIFDKLNELHDFEFLIDATIRRLNTIELKGNDVFSYDLVFKNID